MYKVISGFNQQSNVALFIEWTNVLSIKYLKYFSDSWLFLSRRKQIFLQLDSLVSEDSSMVKNNLFFNSPSI